MQEIKLLTTRTVFGELFFIHVQSYNYVSRQSEA